jgi:hypothetical protein
MFGALALGVLYLFGLWWCYEVICRLREDIQEIRQVKQISHTVAILFVWVLTVIIAALLIRYGLVVIRTTVSFVRDLL